MPFYIEGLYQKGGILSNYEAPRAYSHLGGRFLEVGTIYWPMRPMRPERPPDIEESFLAATS